MELPNDFPQILLRRNPAGMDRGTGLESSALRYGRRLRLQSDTMVATMMSEHSDLVRIAVIDGNKRYTVVSEGKLRYNGNNPAKFYWAKLMTRRSMVRTTIKHGTKY